MTPPTRLGPLALETRLGDFPSQSQVWRAIHLKHRKSLAVKVFQTPFGVTPEAKKSLVDEWTRLQTLDHPAIAKCFGGGFEPGFAYLAYELVEGDTLSSILERRGRLPWESTLDLAETLISALGYLHQHGFGHGKLVASKIIMAGLSPVILNPRVDRYGSPFRSTRPPDQNDSVPLTPGGGSAGELSNSTSDIVALGRLLYRCLTGRPFQAGVADEPPSSIVSEIPVWIDRFVLPMMQTDASAQPPSFEALALQLNETRRRCWSRTSVTEATSRGFSPLDTSNQHQRGEARRLLGREPRSVRSTTDADGDATPWYQSATALFLALMGSVAICAFMLWPLSEDAMRSKAEALLRDGTRASFSRARNRYLEPMLAEHPDGEHAAWARQQIERIDMEWAESALNTRLKKNLPLQNEGERLYAEAHRYERFGDRATALDRYQSLVTLLGDQEKYRPFVNLARRQIAGIRNEIQSSPRGSEAAVLVDAKLQQARSLLTQGKTVEAKAILYSLIELYQGNAEVERQVEAAQELLNTERDERAD